MEGRQRRSLAHALNSQAVELGISSADFVIGLAYHIDELTVVDAFVVEAQFGCSLQLVLFEKFFLLLRLLV